LTVGQANKTSINTIPFQIQILIGITLVLCGSSVQTDSIDSKKEPIDVIYSSNITTKMLLKVD